MDFQEMGSSRSETVSVIGQKDGTNRMTVEYGNLLRYHPRTDELIFILPQKDGPEIIYYQAAEMSRNQWHLYIGASSGILAYDIYTQKLSRMRPINRDDAQTVNTSIVYLTGDEAGELWVGIWGKGVLRISDPLTFPSISMQLNTRIDPDLLSDLMAHILIKGKTLFFCTTNGLNRLRLMADGKIKELSAYQADASLPASISTNYPASIDCNDDSACWVGTIEGELNKLVLYFECNNDYTATTYTIQGGLPNNDCEIVLLDRQGNVWVGGNSTTQLNP